MYGGCLLCPLHPLLVLRCFRKILMGLFTYASEPRSPRFSLGGEVSCITVSAMFILLKSCYIVPVVYGNVDISPFRVVNECFYRLDSLLSFH